MIDTNTELPVFTVVVEAKPWGKDHVARFANRFRGRAERNPEE